MRLAGFVGVDPRPFTFRELFIMAEGKRAEDWCYWSEILALTANCHRDPKRSKVIQADTIHPYRRRKPNRGAVSDAISAVRDRGFANLKGAPNAKRV